MPKQFRSLDQIQVVSPCTADWDSMISTGSFPIVSEKSDPRNHTKKERIRRKTRTKDQKFKSLWLEIMELLSDCIDEIRQQSVSRALQIRPVRHDRQSGHHVQFEMRCQ